MLTEESSLEAFKKDLGIVGTPTILFLEQGREIFRIPGLADLDLLRRFVRKVLGNQPSGSHEAVIEKKNRASGLQNIIGKGEK